MEDRELYRIISDIFTVPGLFCLFIGGLLWLSGKGAFDGVGYVLGNALRLLTFQPRRAYAPRKKKTAGCGFLFVTGAVCLAAAGVFTVLFYR